MISKTVLITGATDGIGLYTALGLAKLNFNIIIHGRNNIKCEKAVFFVRNFVPNSEISFVTADLSDFNQVKTLSENLLNQNQTIDILINNAGVYMNELELNNDGIEMTMAVNHFAHFILTNNILPLIEKSDSGRIIHVSSIAHSRGKIDFYSFFGKENFNHYAAYAQSKLVNVIYSNILSEKLQTKNITSNSLHPGVITTKLLQKGFNMTGASLEEGSETSIFLATSPEVKDISGKYFIKSKQAPFNNLANDKIIQDKLLEMSNEVTNKYLIN